MDFVTGLLSNTSVAIGIIVVVTALLLRSHLRKQARHDVDLSIDYQELMRREGIETEERERENIRSL